MCGGRSGSKCYCVREHMPRTVARLQLDHHPRRLPPRGKASLVGRVEIEARASVEVVVAGKGREVRPALRREEDESFGPAQLEVKVGIQVVVCRWDKEEQECFVRGHTLPRV